jgi:hypothetical protein
VHELYTFVHWPPANDQTWLTRDMVLRLKDNFETHQRGSQLYRHLLNGELSPNPVETHVAGNVKRIDGEQLAEEEQVKAPETQGLISSFTLKKPTFPTRFSPNPRRKTLADFEAINVDNYTQAGRYVMKCTRYVECSGESS